MLAGVTSTFDPRDARVTERARTADVARTRYERDAEVLALYPHMHRAGVALRLARARDDSCMLDVPSWRYGAQELVRPATPLRVSAREPLSLSCTWDVADREGETVFGEGTDDEMCTVFLFVAAPSR